MALHCRLVLLLVCRVFAEYIDEHDEYAHASTSRIREARLCGGGFKLHPGSKSSLEPSRKSRDTAGGAPPLDGRVGSKRQ